MGRVPFQNFGPRPGTGFDICVPVPCVPGPNFNFASRPGTRPVPASPFSKKKSDSYVLFFLTKCLAKTQLQSHCKFGSFLEDPKHLQTCSGGQTCSNVCKIQETTNLIENIAYDIKEQHFFS